MAMLMITSEPYSFHHYTHCFRISGEKKTLGCFKLPQLSWGEVLKNYRDRKIIKLTFSIASGLLSQHLINYWL